MQGKNMKVHLILVLFLLLMACEKDGYDAPEEQAVYFEYHYVNHAWGVQDTGWLIDGGGTIRRFDFPEDYNTGMHGDFLSLEQLEHNLVQADSVLGEVGSKKLEKQIQLIQGASLGELSKVHRQGADMGSGVYSCYKYHPEENAYQIILLEIWGDNQQYNSSSEAEKLAEWLKELVD
jgi:hypothetical protein